MKRVLKEAEINELIEAIQGTCKTIDNMLLQCFDIEDMSDIENEIEICSYIDNAIFECADCGWWCENGDCADIQRDDGNGDVCSDCGKSFEDE